MSRVVDLERWYSAAPVWLQNVIATLEGWRLARRRFDSAYHRIEERVVARRGLNGRELSSLQAERLIGHLRCAQGSPFWRKRFSDFGVHTRGSNPFDELAKLPILLKHEVQANAAAIRVPNLDGEEILTVHTSGTTGTGLVFWETRTAERERWATWWRYRRSLGLSREVWSAHFGGRSIVPIGQRRAPFWRSNLVGRQLLLSAYHLSEATVEAYWEALNRSGVRWLHGYPSFISLLADLAVARGLSRLESVEWVTTGAENLLPSQRRRIESVFGAKVYQHYGQTESVANMSEAADSDRLVVDEDFSFVEFVDVGPWRPSRIIGTNWSNPAFPLFRYDTGDVGHLAETQMSSGWREVTRIDGRREDFVILPTGEKVGRLDHIFKDLVHIREAQIWQPSADRVVFRIVRGVGFESAGEEKRLLMEAQSRLGLELKIEIEFVQQIPRTKSGKLRFVVSDLKAGKLH